MQVKKFEAPTIQEALDTIKRELGPEAIILTTRKNRKGFGLLAKSSVEITAAVSERALSKKQFLEKRVPQQASSELKKLPAEKQREVLDQFAAPALERAEQRRRNLPAAGKGGAGTDVRAARYGAMAGSVSAVGLGGHGAEAMAEPTAVDLALRSGAAAVAGGAIAAAGTGLMERIFGKGGSNAAQAKGEAKGSSQARRYIDIDAHEIPGALDETRAVGQPALPQPQAGETGDYQARKLAEELVRLRKVVDEIKQERVAPATGRPAVFESVALQEAYDLLVVNGIERRFALELLKKVDFELGGAPSSDREIVMDRLAAEIMDHIIVRSPFASAENAERQIIALVGPTGVGKTTTLAKIASLCLHRAGKSVALVNIDQYKVGAFDQFATYAKILGVPFRSVSNAEDFRAALADFAQKDVVLVDTTGRSQKDAEALDETQKVLGAAPGIRTMLVVSATTRDAEILDTVRRFKTLSCEGIIVSKLDEATVYGTIYNVAQRSKLPLFYFTTGQRVPEDIEEASGERLVSLVMDI